jgi:hypothetical protein
MLQFAMGVIVGIAVVVLMAVVWANKYYHW